MTPVRAQVWHAPRLLQIMRGFGRESDWLPQVRGPLDDFISILRLIRRGWVRVLRCGQGGIVGFIARDGETVHALYVDARMRGQGGGGALLAEAKTQHARLVLWTAQANSRARQFYARQGFAEVDRGDGRSNDENLPEIQLIWEKENVQ